MFYDFVLEARYVAILFRFVSLLMEGCGVASSGWPGRLGLFPDSDVLLGRGVCCHRLM